MNGIDVSHWQGDINWKAVRDAGIEFAILKAGGSDKGLYKDGKFETYYAEAKKYGIPVGAYYYVGSKCVSAADGIADAKRFLEIIKGKQFEYPVYIDLESTNPPAKNGATEATIAFCDTMAQAGYCCGIYASDISGFKERLNIDLLTKYDKWVARYGSAPKYVEDYGIWQKSETGKVNGISGNVDLDVCTVDYPAYIKSNGLNGYEKPASNASEPEPAESNAEPERKDTIPVTITVNGKTYSGVLTAVE